MKNDEPQDLLFAPFREAQAPAHFCDRVMECVRRDANNARAPKNGARSWVFRWVPGLFRNSRTRWVWALGPAAAMAVYFLAPRTVVPVSVSDADVSIYLADSATVEEEAVLGTDIETIFL